MEIGSCADCVVGADLEARMVALKSIGFDFIEPAWREAELPRLGESFGAELRELGERTGCPVRSAILGTFPTIGERLRTSDSRAQELDVVTRACQTLAVAGGDVLLLPNYAAQYAEDYDVLYREFLAEAGTYAGTLGVKLGIEHIPASKYRNSAVQVFELVEKINHESVGVYFDIANGLYIDEDSVEAARKVVSRVVQYHVKDYPKGNLSFEAMPLREIKAIFTDANYKGRIATEIGPAEEQGEKTNDHLIAAMATLRQNGF
jgi:sugar phosphate isomerase/epimerase